MGMGSLDNPVRFSWPWRRVVGVSWRDDSIVYIAFATRFTTERSWEGQFADDLSCSGGGLADNGAGAPYWGVYISEIENRYHENFEDDGHGPIWGSMDGESWQGLSGAQVSGLPDLPEAVPFGAFEHPAPMNPFFFATWNGNAVTFTEEHSSSPSNGVHFHAGVAQHSVNLGGWTSRLQDDGGAELDIELPFSSEKFENVLQRDFATEISAAFTGSEECVAYWRGLFAGVNQKRFAPVGSTATQTIAPLTINVSGITVTHEGTTYTGIGSKVLFNVNEGLLWILCQSESETS